MEGILDEEEIEENLTKEELEQLEMNSESSDGEEVNGRY